MTYGKLLNALGPCGLNCAKCFAHVNGDIRKYSMKLKEKIGNFDSSAKRFEILLDNPIFEKYPDFKIFLDYLASENCNGCRKENCKIFKNCGVRNCHQQKVVDFCFQCENFPCDRTNFDEKMRKRWIILNNHIREQGIEKFYIETKDKPRYG